MSCETLRLLRNILLRSFVIGLGLALILVIITLNYWAAWMPLATGWFHTDATILTPIVLKFFVDLRFFLFFVLLTPGLAIHWTLKRELARTKVGP